MVGLTIVLRGLLAFLLVNQRSSPRAGGDVTPATLRSRTVDSGGA
jgi:hypothetical protein